MKHENVKTIAKQILVPLSSESSGEAFLDVILVNE
jgi:hypothetical protein